MKIDIEVSPEELAEIGPIDLPHSIIDAIDDKLSLPGYTVTLNTGAAMAARAAWLQQMHTLHRTVEMLYVVDGYHVTLCWDGSPISPDYHGETLDQAIDKAMAEFDANAKPKWQHRDGDPALIEEQLAAAQAQNAVLLEFFKASSQLESTVGHEDATAEDERAAELRYNTAFSAARAAIAAGAA